MRRYAVHLVAVAAILTTGFATRLPGPPDVDPNRFAFERQEITSIPVAGYARLRQVSPVVAKIQAWISAVGAAVALADVDGNGLADDACLTDPRTDTITVSSVRPAGPRYAPFVLDPAPLAYDRSTTAPMGCLPGDFNEDGRLDLVTYYWGRTPVLFLRSAGSGPPGPDGYTRHEVAPGGQRWYTDTIASTDVDGDGHLDLIVGNYFPDGARLLDPRATTDPVMAMQDSMSRAYNGGRNRILLGRPAGFVEATGVFPEHSARAWTLAIGAHDLTGDLLPELYFANDFGPDRLYLNRSTPGRVELVEVRGRGGFFTPKSKVLGNDSFKGMGVDFADMNSDGRTDMFVSNISTEFGLMESNFAWIGTGRAAAELDRGRAPFADRSDALGLARTGWGWDAKFADFDADTVPELVQATGFVRGEANLWPQVAELAMANDTLLDDLRYWMNFEDGWDLAGHQDDVFFVRGRDGRWADVAGRVGIADQGISRGVAVADVDADNRLDFALARQWEPSHLHLNRSAPRGPALRLRLLLPPAGDVAAGSAGDSVTREGTAGDRLTGSPAVGATATVTLPGGKRFTAQVDGGNGHASVRAPELFFGLGPLATGTDRIGVRIDWRDRQGRRQHRELALTPGRWSLVLGGGA